MLRNLTISLMFIGLMVSCSKNKTESTDLNSGVELADADEFLLEGTDAGLGYEGEALEPASDQQDVFANNEVTMGQDPLVTEPEVGLAETNLVVDPVSTNEQVMEQGVTSSYQVKKNETLMMIAFQIYGDYEKWRVLQQQNPHLGVNIKEGDVINYEAPANAFNWQPSGNPYLIKKGDTLGTISTDTYGVSSHWRKIWKNNEPLIKDPNKIFSGFTIYTPILDNRDVASQI